MTPTTSPAQTEHEEKQAAEQNNHLIQVLLRI